MEMLLRSEADMQVRLQELSAQIEQLQSQLESTNQRLNQVIGQVQGLQDANFQNLAATFELSIQDQTAQLRKEFQALTAAMRRASSRSRASPCGGAGMPSSRACSTKPLAARTSERPLLTAPR